MAIDAGLRLLPSSKIDKNLSTDSGEVTRQ